MPAKNKAEIIITAKDLASGKFKDIDREMKGFSRRVSDNFNSMTRSAKGLQTAIVAVAGAYGFKMLSNAIMDVVKHASDLQEVQGKFSVVFKGQTDLANKWAAELRQNYGMSRREARQYLAAIQDLLVPMGMAAQKAGVLSNNIVRLSADLGSFNNLPTAKVMDDIQSALVGNYETMKKYGVVLNATVVQEKALAMGLAKSKGELTAAQKAQAAYTLIVEGSAAAIGDYNRTADGYANVTRRMQNRIEDLKGTLGRIFIPIATEIAEKISNWIEENEELIAQNVPEYADKIATSFKKIAEAVQTAVGWWAELNQKVEEFEKWKRETAKASRRSFALNAQDLGPASELAMMRDAEGGPRFRGRVSYEGWYPEGLEGITPPDVAIPGGAVNRLLDKKLNKLKETRKKHHEEMAEIQRKALAAELAALDKAMAEETRIIEKAQKAQEDATKKAAEERAAAAEKWAEAVKTPMERLIDDLNEINELYAAGAMTADTYALALEMIAQQMADLSNKTEQTSNHMKDFMDRAGQGMKAGLSDVFFNIIKGDFQNFEQIAMKVFDNVARAFSDMLAEMISEAVRAQGIKLIKSLFSGFGAGGGYTYTGDFGGGLYDIIHGGGLVGGDVFPKRSVPNIVFALAPRLHHGLAPDEFPAILQAGERVLRKGDSGPVTNVTIINKTSAQPKTQERRNSTGGSNIEIMLDEAVANSINRGGKTAQAIEGKYGLFQNPGGR